MFAPDFVQDERKLLKRRDDDLFAALDEAPQVARMLGVPHGNAHLGELFDCVPDLLVQDAAVSARQISVSSPASLVSVGFMFFLQIFWAALQQKRYQTNDGVFLPRRAFCNEQR